MLAGRCVLCPPHFAPLLLPDALVLSGRANFRVDGYAEFIPERHLFAGWSEFSWEIPASHLELRIAVRPSPVKSASRNVGAI
jgi:hypothetical protein